MSFKHAIPGISNIILDSQLSLHHLFVGSVSASKMLITLLMHPSTEWRFYTDNNNHNDNFYLKNMLLKRQLDDNLSFTVLKVLVRTCSVSPFGLKKRLVEATFLNVVDYSDVLHMNPPKSSRCAVCIVVSKIYH